MRPLGLHVVEGKAATETSVVRAGGHQDGIHRGILIYRSHGKKRSSIGARMSSQRNEESCPPRTATDSRTRRNIFSAGMSFLALQGFCGDEMALGNPSSGSIGQIVPRPADLLVQATIRLDLAPDQSQYDATDSELRRAANMIQKALNAESVREEEKMWTEIIEEFKNTQSNWRDDVVGRALGNRGNARSRQGKLNEALQDYNESIKTCPWSVDPVLNRGVVLEALGRFDEAKEDYVAVLQVDPNDPAAWNNLGNACAGSRDYESAVKYYDKAVRLAPKFSFAAANKALALYQTGKNDDEAIKEFQSLLRKYPDFSDVRAALASAMWISGDQAGAEEAWVRVDDTRYKNLNWLKEERRWPPRLVEGVSNYLSIVSK